MTRIFPIRSACLYILCLFVSGPVLGQVIETHNIPSETTAPIPGKTKTNISYPPDFTGTGLPLHHTEKRIYKNKTHDVAAVSYQNYYSGVHVFNAAGNVVFEVARMAVERTTQAGQHDAYIRLHDRMHGTVQRSFPDVSQPLLNTQAYNADFFSKQRAYYLDQHPDEDTTAVVYTENTSTSQKRSVTTYAPGLSQIGKGRGVETIYAFNTAADYVREWTIGSTGELTASGFYAPRQLLKTTTISEMGAETELYTHRSSGKVVLEKTKLGTDWSYTYHVYDDFHRLRFVIQPKALAGIAATTSPVTLSSDVIRELCFSFDYDGEGRLMRERKAGEQYPTTYIYDLNDHAALVQTPSDVDSGRWRVTFRDGYGRPVATGVVDTANPDREAVLAALKASFSNANPLPGSLAWYFNHVDGIGQVPAEGTHFSEGVGHFYLLSESYYDHYEVADPSGDFTADMISRLYMNLPTPAPNNDSVMVSFTNGQLTGSRVRIIGNEGEIYPVSETGEWQHTVIRYNRNYTPLLTGIQTVYDDGQQLLYKDYTGYYYNHQGLLQTSYHYILNELEQSHHSKEQLEVLRHQYNWITGKLQKIERYQGVPGPGPYTFRTLAAYQYDELNRLKDETFGNLSEHREYTYNIRGQLLGINERYAVEGFKGAASPKTFGIALRYDYGFTTRRYDGKVSGILWRGGADYKQHAYGYHYDPGGRLTAARYRFREQSYRHQTTGNWDTTTYDFTVRNLSYDLNGNILGMEQKGKECNTAPHLMDRLTYTYLSNSNKLLEVKDDILTPNSTLGDFHDGNTTGNDYAYDAAGNLVMDKNKDIVHIRYNVLNKPEEIEFEDGMYFRYIYDGSGNKLYEYTRKVVGSEGDEMEVEVKRTYLTNFVYINDSLRHISHAVGRSVMDPATADEYREEFFIKDHLGNIRSVVDYEYQSLLPKDYTATYEVASLDVERLLFNHIDEISAPAPVIDPGNEYAGKLDAVNGTAIGTSILLQVMAGDVFRVGAHTWFEDDGSGGNYLPDEDMLHLLYQSLQGNVSDMPGIEGDPHSIVEGIFEAPDLAAHVTDLMEGGDYEENDPRAFLTYVLFDEDFQPVALVNGALQAKGGTPNWQQIESEDIEIPTNGYLLVYAASMAGKAVFFDNMFLRLSKGNLQEETHYYPHGLPIKVLSAKASGSIENRHRYQGNEYVEDNDLRWMDFHARQYDPQIGRFLGIDPLAYSSGQHIYSPYAAMGNSPGMYIDPNGERFTPYDDTYMSDHIMEQQDGALRHFLGSISNTSTMMLNSIGGGFWGMNGVNFNIKTAILRQAMKNRNESFWNKINEILETYDHSDNIRMDIDQESGTINVYSFPASISGSPQGYYAEGSRYCVYTSLETIDASLGKRRTKEDFLYLYAGMRPKGSLFKVGYKEAKEGVNVTHYAQYFDHAGFEFDEYLPKQYMLNKGLDELIERVFTPLSEGQFVIMRMRLKAQGNTNLGEHMILLHSVQLDIQMQEVNQYSFWDPINGGMKSSLGDGVFRNNRSIFIIRGYKSGR